MEIFLSRLEKLFLQNWILISILVVTFLVRLPSLFEPLWYGDEAIYLTIGQKLARGGLMYVDIFDHKTPGVYYLAAATIKLLGASIWSFRFLLMIWTLGTLIAFYAAAKRMFDKKIALWAVVFLSALTSTPLLEGNIVNSEILMILPISFGILAGLNKRFFLSGIFFSFAFLLKFPAIFDFAAFFVLITLMASKSTIFPTIRNLLNLSAGFLLPILLTVIYFFTKGGLGTYFHAAFLFNVSYTSYKNHFIIDNGLLIVKALPLVLILVYFFARIYSRLKTKQKVEVNYFEFLAIWLIFSFYGAVFGGRPYEHYLIQAAPPFSLIAALILFEKNLVKVGSILLAGVIILTLVLRFQPFIPPFYYLNFFRYTSGRISFDTYTSTFNSSAERDYALASFLKGCRKYNQEGSCIQTRTTSEDSLYVFSNHPSIYFLSGLDPASRYITFFHIAGDENARKDAASEIARQEPKYILAERPLSGQFPRLENILSSRYNLLASYEDVDIYQRAQKSPF